MKATRIPQRVIDRATLRVVGPTETGCLISTYSVGSHGYAQIGWYGDGERTMTLVHRVVWIGHHGLIPDGMTVDHMCKTRACANIEHLRLLSNYENARRTSGRDWPLGRCINGHPNSELRFWAGRLRCRICTNDVQRRRRANRRANQP